MFTMLCWFRWDRNHQGREMCTSRMHNKFTWSGLMIYEMIFVGDRLILYPYLLKLFYVLLPYPPSPISGIKFKMISVSTCYFGVIISCVRYRLIWYMQDNWNAFGEMKMLIFSSPEWTILKKVESTVCSTFSDACLKTKDGLHLSIKRLLLFQGIHQKGCQFGGEH